MTTPQAIQLSVLGWAPPMVHGLVRDLRVCWALEQGPKGADVKALRAWFAGWTEARLDVLVRVLGGKDYLLDRFTAANLLLTTVLRILRGTDYVKKRPALDACQRRCEARPAFQKALEAHLANFAKHAPSTEQR